MAKINYGKVENSLTTGLKKYKRDELLDEAKKIQSERTHKKLIEEGKEGKIFDIKQNAIQSVIGNIKKDLTKLSKKSKKTLFEDIGLTQEEIKTYLQDYKNLSNEDMGKIKNIQSLIASYTENIENVDEEYDDRIIEDEVSKHKNKRFNIKDGWLPS